MSKSGLKGWQVTKERIRAERLEERCVTVCQRCGKARKGRLADNNIWFKQHVRKCRKANVGGNG